MASRDGARAPSAFASWLTPTRVRAYPIVIGAVTLLMLAATVVRGQAPRDIYGKVVAVDFLGHYTGGVLALAGETSRLYDLDRQLEIQRALTGPGPPAPLDAFLSPPFVAYLYAPFAALPYLWAAALWTALSVCAFAIAMRLLAPLAPNAFRGGTAVFVAASSAPFLETLGAGQDGAVSLLIFVVALRLLVADRDLLAGAVLGLGAFKPQLFTLVPLVLACRGRFRACASFGAVVAALTAISIGLVGLEGVAAYRALLSSATYEEGIAGALAYKMTTLLALVRTVLPPSASLVASIVGGVASVAVIAVVLRAARRSGGAADGSLAIAYGAGVVGALVVAPHAFLYDGLVAAVPAALLAERAARLDARARERTKLLLAGVYVATWVVPLAVAALAGRAYPLSALAIPAGTVAAGALLAHATHALAPPRDTAPA